MTHKNGRLVIIEGLDGTGKTTLMWGLNKKLVEDGINIHPTWSPGDSTYNNVFDTFLDREQAVRAASPHAALLTRLADHAAHVDEMILPKLHAGDHVITDRSLESFRVYQDETFDHISHRKLTSIFRTLDIIAEDITEAADDILFIFLVADYDVCTERIRKRGQGADEFESVPMEEWLDRLDNYYYTIGAHGTVLELDTSDQTETEVLEAAYPIVWTFLQGGGPYDQ